MYLALVHCKGQFRVISPSLDLLTGHLISSFGAFRSTHWQQTVVYIDEPISVEQDTVVAGTIQLTPCERRNPYVRPKWRQFIASHLNLVVLIQIHQVQTVSCYLWCHENGVIVNIKFSSPVKSVIAHSLAPGASDDDYSLDGGKGRSDIDLSRN